MTTTKLNLMTDDQLIAYAQQACQPSTLLSGTPDETVIAELLISLLMEMEQTERLLTSDAINIYSAALDPDDDDEEVEGEDDEDDDDLDDDDDDDDFGDDDEDDMDDDDDDEPVEEAEDEDDM
jgi:hypothetical protein